MEELREKIKAELERLVDELNEEYERDTNFDDSYGRGMMEAFETVLEMIDGND